MKIFCIYKAEPLPRSEVVIIAQQLILRFLQTRDYELIQSSQRPHNVGITIIVSISFSTRKLYLLTFLKTNTKYPWAERMPTSSTQGTETTPVLVRCERKPTRALQTHRKHLEPSASTRERVWTGWALCLGDGACRRPARNLAASSWAHQTPGVPVLRRCSPAGPRYSQSFGQCVFRRILLWTLC